MPNVREEVEAEARPPGDAPAGPALEWAHAKLRDLYLEAWSLAHDAALPVRARRMARSCLDAMTRVLEAQLPGVPAGAGLHFSGRKERRAA